VDSEVAQAAVDLRHLEATILQVAAVELRDIQPMVAAQATEATAPASLALVVGEEAEMLMTVWLAVAAAQDSRA
jgi:hypothetical protein